MKYCLNYMYNVDVRCNGKWSDSPQCACAVGRQLRCRGSEVGMIRHSMSCALGRQLWFATMWVCRGSSVEVIRHNVDAPWVGSWSAVDRKLKCRVSGVGMIRHNVNVPWVVSGSDSLRCGSALKWEFKTKFHRAKNSFILKFNQSVYTQIKLDSNVKIISTFNAFTMETWTNLFLLNNTILWRALNWILL
jgi:hypothetical protein